MVSFKKIFITLGMAVSLATPALASQNSIDLLSYQTVLTSLAPFDLINWKVGDTANYNISAGFFGKVGVMVKSVTKDEGTAIWITQNMELQGQKQVVEILISKADGKTLRMIVNGKEEKIPDDKLEIISQDYAEVTVPAGKFETIHIVAKTEKVKKLEVWINPRDTVMEGTVKQIVNTGMFDLTMELTSFNRMP
ncbi:MAG: hypothetical protein A2X94_09810 [Bdellovibrionales bacterium GWB1_55_8]|nr:MAG: hypothetical protein A2X94_09810 [Bdellovibrionales bacterium GWB1_55_8]